MTQLVYLTNKVNNSAIRRTRNERGDLVYVVPSYTLPADCVMNGGLYPGSEIEKSYMTLENTPAPASHPVSASGEYIPANSPEGILYFQCGIFNKNVQLVSDEKYGTRVYIEKHIHVETAMKTERGKRIINAIDKGEPIHTSTGVLLDPVDEAGVSPKGVHYTWRATNLLFDHDAILLDEDGAATPADGVGLLVNQNLIKQVQRNGQIMAVNSVSMNAEQPIQSDESGLFARMLDRFKEFLANHGENYGAETRKSTTQNQEGDDMAYKERVEAALKKANIDFTNMDEEEKMNAYDKLLKGNAAEKGKESKGEQSQPEGETVVNADLQKVIAEQVAQALAANKKAEEAQLRVDLAEQLKANGVTLSEAEQAAMSVNSLKSLVDKTKAPKAAYNFGGQPPVTDENIYAVNSMPDVE